MTNKNRFKFCGISNEHNNQVDIEISGHTITLHCYTDGYNGTIGGRFCAGGNDYTFPSDIEPTYENIIHFIINNTWIGNDIEDIVDKSAYEIFIKSQRENLKCGNE